MKRNRGRALVWLLCFLPLWLGAQTTYRWSMTQSKTEAARLEAVAVEYTCRFDTEGYEYIIVFDPPKETEAYRLVPVSAQEQVIDGKRINTFRFIFFPKREGILKLPFSASMEHTSKASIENTVIGRDNVQKIDYTAERVFLPEAVVAVEPNDSAYAGRFDLAIEVDKREVPAYTPVQIRIRLQGYGNLDEVPPFALEIPEVKQFTDGLQKQIALGEDGWRGTVEQSFAVVSARSFTVPAMQLRYFDTEQGRMVTRSTEPVTVRVAPAAPLPAVPQAVKEEDAEVAGRQAGWLQLILALLAGIVIGRFLIPVRGPQGTALPYSDQLQRCKEPEKFVAYLAIRDAEGDRELIDEIETKLRKGERIDLASYKRRLGEKAKP